MAERHTSLPKYLRISRDVIADIRRGRLREGSRVPSENELIREYGVSNTTARKAHQDLERDGWAIRIKGKGTFVRQRSVNRSVDRILSFTRNMLQEGRTPGTEVLDVRVRRKPRALTIQGRTYKLRGPMAVLERLRYSDGVPMMKETRYISLRFCPDIQGKELTQSLYGIYENDYHLRLTEIHQMLSTILLQGQELGWLGGEEPTPAFCVEGVTLCGKELILEMERSVYRGDLYRFLVTATPNGREPAQ